MSTKKIRNLVCISDTHCGCKLALCPPDGIQLDDGGKYMPSKVQLKMWAWWEEFWGKFVPDATHGEPFAVIHNGDCIDGVHHNSTTQISHNIGDQNRAAVGILRPVVEACEGRYYHIRGTEAHVGQSGREEEEVAKALNAIPNEEGQYSRWDLRLKIGDHIVHALHHIGTTGSTAHESSALCSEIAATLSSCARWNLPMPSVLVRSHRHASSEVRLPTKHGFMTCTVTPAWQLKTPFAWKIPGARLTPSQIGATVIRDGGYGIYTNIFCHQVEPSPLIKPSEMSSKQYAKIAKAGGDSPE